MAVFNMAILIPTLTARRACGRVDDWELGIVAMLELELARAGRRPQAVSAELVREITEADVALLAVAGETKAPPLKRLRDRHHALARMLASGLPEGEAAIVCGYDPSRVSVLKADPTFQALLKFYRDAVEPHYADLHERLSGLSIDAVEELRGRLEDEPESVSTALLLDIATKGADRTGFGPTSTQVSLTANLGDKLKLARERVRERRLKDITPAEEVDG